MSNSNNRRILAALVLAALVALPALAEEGRAPSVSATDFTAGSISWSPRMSYEKLILTVQGGAHSARTTPPHIRPDATQAVGPRSPFPGVGLRDSSSAATAPGSAGRTVAASASSGVNGNRRTIASTPPVPEPTMFQA